MNRLPLLEQKQALVACFPKEACTVQGVTVTITQQTAGGAMQTQGAAGDLLRLRSREDPHGRDREIAVGEATTNTR